MWPLPGKKPGCSDLVFMSSGIVYCQFSATGITGALVKIQDEYRGGLSSLQIMESKSGNGTFTLVHMTSIYNRFSTLDPDDEKTIPAFVGIEEFANREVAKEALNAITRVISLEAARSLRYKRIGWIGLPAIFALLALIAIASKTTVPTASTIGTVPSFNLPTGSGGEMNQNYEAIMSDIRAGRTPNFDTQPQAAASPPSIPEKVALKSIDGLNQIRFGDKKPALYVFADPTCPACKELEIILHEMKVSFSVIPVPIKGNDAAVRAARIMCSSNQAEAWKKEINGIETPLETVDRSKLAVCAQKVIDNMNKFRALGMPGTPVVISAANGTVGMPETKEAIAALIKGAKGQ